MIKPNRLHPGDCVAIVSLSSGMMGEDMFIHRYNIAKDRLEKEYGFKVITMPNALKGIKYLNEHPELRAKDLMDAFLNSNVKAIFNAIGGSGGLEILPYIDFDVIKNNPKIFTGFSDTTTHHFMMHKAGLISYYGLSVMDNLGEYVKMNSYTSFMIDKMLINPSDNLAIYCSEFTSDDNLRTTWNINNINKIRETYPNTGYEILMGHGVIKGELFGGCLELFPSLMKSNLWPSLAEFKDKILLMETFDMKESKLKDILLTLKDMGIFKQIKGIIFGRASQKERYETYKDVIKDVIPENIVVLYNVNVGHNYPIGLFGLGLTYEINCEAKTLTLLELGSK